MANVTIAGGTTNLPVANTIDGVNDYLPIYTASALATQAINRNTLLGLASGPVGLTDSQAITNKTLGNTNTVTLKDTLFTLQDDGDITKQAMFQLSSITTGNTRTYTLPDITDTLVTLGATQTLTAKTLTSPTINSPTIANATITADAIAGFTSPNNGTIYGMSVTSGILASAALVGQVNTAALQTNAVGASNIATNAIKLGMATITGNITTTSTSFVQATGLTAPVTIPSGGRSVKITVIADSWFNSGANFNTLSIWDGTVGSGTQIAQQEQSMIAGNDQFVVICMAVVTPGAGSKTYNVGWKTTGGTATILASSVAPAMILVEAI